MSSLASLCSLIRTYLPNDLIPVILSFSHRIEFNQENVQQLLKSNGLIKFLFGKFDNNQILLLYTNFIFHESIEEIAHNHDDLDDDFFDSDDSDFEEEQDDSLSYDQLFTYLSPIFLSASSITCFFRNLQFLKVWQHSQSLTITTLNLSRRGYLSNDSGENLNILLNCTNLRKLSLTWEISSSLFYDLIRNVTSLQSLHVLRVINDESKTCSVNDQYSLTEFIVDDWCLKHLPVIPSLHKLSILSFSVDNFQLNIDESIVAMSALTDLTISKGTSDITAIQLLTSLTKLSITGSFEGQELLSLVTYMSSLTQLTVDKNNCLNNATSWTDPVNTNLISIKIHESPLKPNALMEGYILRCTNLLNLDLTSCEVQDSTSENLLDALSRLENLNLSCNPNITEKGLNGVAMRALRELHLHQFLGKSEIQQMKTSRPIISVDNFIGGHQMLTKLTLSNMMIDDEGACIIAKLPALRHVRFGNAPIGNKGARALLSSPTLQVLSLFGCLMDDTALEPLKTNATLWHLNLCMCRYITPACAKTLFIHNTTISELYLDNFEIVVAGMNWLKNQSESHTKGMLYSPMRSVFIITPPESISIIEEARKYGILLPLYS